MLKILKAFSNALLFCSWLLVSASMAQTDGARVLTGSAQPPLPFNILPQPGFENRTTGWSVTSGTFTTTQVTADVARGRFSAAWTVPASTAAGTVLQSDPISVPPGLMGRSCVAIVLSRGNAATNGTMSLDAYDGTTAYGARAISNAVTYTRTSSTAFTCPTSGTLRLRIKTTATSPASPTQVLFDEAYLGENVSVGTGGGGALDVTPTVSVTNATTVAFTPTTRGIVYVQGNGAAVTADATTPLTAGNTDGQELILIGRSNSNTLTIANSGNVRLKEAITLKQGCALYLEWDLNDGKWSENARSCSTGALDSTTTTVADGATLAVTKQARNVTFIQGASGVSTLNATTAFTTGALSGQELTLVGTSDTNTVIILSTTSNVYMPSGNITLSSGSVISYVWNASTSKWNEVYRSPNVGLAPLISVLAKSANYTLTANDQTVVGSTSGGAFTITLPTAVGISGQIFNIIKGDSSANLLTLNTTSSQTIGKYSATSTKLDRQGEIVSVQSDGANWVYLSDEWKARSARINNPSGSATIASQEGAWVSTVNRTSAGSIDEVFVSGIFSSTPNCNCNTDGTNGVYLCYGQPTSVTALTSKTGTSASSLDTNLVLICRGPR